jgi:DNA-binding transcriptional LysR family regulator
MLSTRHEVFYQVALNLSFSKASQVLYISQPAISKHIKVLEAYYKIPLFERKKNTISLTEGGQILLNQIKEAKRIESLLEYQLSIIHNKANAKGELKLGASTTVALYFLPKILSKFHHEFSNININLLNRNTDTIIQALLNEDIDIGIVEGRKKNSSLIYKPFISDEVVAVCSKDSFIARKKSIKINEIVSFPIVLREQGSGTLQSLKESLKLHSIKISDLNVSVRLSGTEALKNFLKADTCLGFLPKGAIIKEIENGELHVVKIEGLKIFRDFYFIQRRGSENNDINKVFIKFCQNLL